MFAYYLQLGLRSLRRNPVLTALMVLAIGFGVAASMVSYAVFRATSNNPIPQKSTQLYTVQIDDFGPADRDADGEPPSTLNYTDALALMRAHKGRRQTALYPVNLSAIPDDPNGMPIRPTSYAVYADAFPMFDVPFLYGGGWSAAQDEGRAAVAVIGRELNQQLFHGANSVGREINLDGRTYRVTGVMDRWDPTPLFFDLAGNGGFTDPVQIFIPMSRAVDLQLTTAGSTDCNKESGNGWDAFIRSTCNWIDYWVELPTTAEATAYRQFLHDYAAEQQRAGRYPWSPNVRLRDVMQWLDFKHVVPRESRLSLYVSLGFLLVCLVNTIGLLLAKFMRRAPEIGVRRALGAPRKAIYTQYLIEAGTVGLAGGLLGLLLTGLGIFGVGLVVDASVARLVTLDVSLVGLTFAAAVLAAVLAAFYPTWRAAQIQPAWQLKSN